MFPHQFLEEKVQHSGQNEDWQHNTDCLAYKQSFVGIIVSFCAFI